MKSSILISVLSAIPYEGRVDYMEVANRLKALGFFNKIPNPIPMDFIPTIEKYDIEDRISILQSHTDLAILSGILIGLEACNYIAIQKDRDTAYVSRGVSTTLTEMLTGQIMYPYVSNEDIADMEAEAFVNSQIDILNKGQQ